MNSKRNYFIGIVAAFFVFPVSVSAQFKVTVNTSNFKAKEAYIDTLDGSKNVFSAKGNKKGDQQWVLAQSKPYFGMMRVYFPDVNESINFAAENRDVTINLDAVEGRISKVTFLDETNLLINKMQNQQRKTDQVYPTLVKMQELYEPTSDFGKALEKETKELSKQETKDLSQHPFVKYYMDTSSEYLSANQDQNPNKKSQVVAFLSNSNNYLETSSLMKPLLMVFLNTTTQESLDKDVEDLLQATNIETSRGQTILSELIEIFDTYNLEVYKNKYLAQAKDLKCTITNRLASTIKVNENIALGAKFANNKFVNPKNTKAKSIYNVVADKKIIFFWSLTCSHCENQIPEMLEKYKQLKDKKIEIIGLSLDTDKTAYGNRVESLPWINDSELKGWNSSYVENYNIHGTPYFFILDAQNKIISKPNTFKEAISFLGLE